MIFKCSECDHILEIEDPAVGWEDNLDIESCPKCSTPLRKSSGQVKLISLLLLVQLLSMANLSMNAIFGFGEPSFVYGICLLVSTFWLMMLNNKKGTPILLRRANQKVEQESESIGLKSCNKA